MNGLPECDAGCTRPVPESNPWALMRLGWTIEGELPTSVYHPPHSQEQPFLVRGYTEWRWPMATRRICPLCHEAAAEHTI